MILKLESINYLLTGNFAPDHKVIMKVAKLKGLKVPDSIRKNLSNNYAGKNQSETTVNNLKIFLRNMFNNDEFEENFDSICSSELIDVSTPILRLDYIISEYNVFFKSIKMDKSFIFHELNKIFFGLKELILLKENGASDQDIEIRLKKGEGFPNIGFEDSLFLEIENKVPAFNFDLLLYLFACLDAEYEFRNKSPFQVFLEQINIDFDSGDNVNLKPPFAYYILAVKYFYEMEGKVITDSQLSNDLGITQREFYFYISGERKPSFKVVSSIIENGHPIYFIIIFWVSILEPFSKEKKTMGLLIDKINNYLSFLKIAREQFYKSNSKQKVGI